MALPADRPQAGERDWWLRALLVLQAPRAAFRALRTDPDDAEQAGQEPITALVLLAGVAVVLGSSTSGRLLDSPEMDGLLLAVFEFLAGGIYGVFAYWLGGGALALGIRGAGGQSPYRRARHVLALASAPLALSLLVLWPLRLALYGGDEFRTGGTDGRAAGGVFELAEWAFVAWALALLVIGLRIVYRLPWPRVGAALGVAALSLAGLVLLFYVAGG
jgi:Yip1 domain